MTKELYDKVVAYRISMSVIKSMLKSNIITAQEYSEIDTIIARENKGDPPVVNEEQAKLVRRIYNLFMSGKTTGGIAKILTEENIPTPSGKHVWQPTTIESILRNEKYKGAARLQKKFTVIKSKNIFFIVLGR